MHSDRRSELNIPQAVLGSIPQWITAGGMVGVGGMFLRFILGRKRLTNADTADLRDHYAEELTSLRKQIIDIGQHHLEREREIDDRWRRLLAESEDRHSECVRQREALGLKVQDMETRQSELHQRQLGMVRQFLHFQQRIVEVLPEQFKTQAIIQAVEDLTPFTEEMSALFHKDEDES